MQNKSKNTLYLVIATFAIILSCSSCEDFFEQKTGNKISPEVHYQSDIDLDISMIGVLIPLQEAMPKLIMIDGLLSDMMDETQNTNMFISNINEHKYSFDNPFLNTSEFYKIIINANEVLANLNRITEVNPNFDEFYIKQYKNALIGIRTWAYFTLLKLNGEAAIIEDNMATIPEEGLKYIDKNAMLDTLINQMLPYLHLDQSLIELSFTYYPNTKALIGEMYLEKDDYANAAYYLKLAMESYENSPKIFKVDRTTSKIAWVNIFIDGANNEVENISVVPFKSDYGQLNPLTSWTLFNDQYLVKPTKEIINKFQSQITLKNDIGDEYRGMGISVDISPNDEPYIKKYALEIGKPYGTDIIISRAGDIHLLLAEALNRLGNHEYALALLNDGFAAVSAVPDEYFQWNKNIGIRGRAYLSNLKVPSDVANKTEYIEDLIIEERALELAFEGKRWFDLMRIARRRGNTDYLASKIANKFEDKDKVQTVKDLLKNEANWYIPLNK